MIVRDRVPLWRVWPAVSRRLILLAGFDLTIALLYTQLGMDQLSLPNLPLAMTGGALSIFLAFRNNSAYDRWWEARTLWGALVNNARTFARQVLTLVETDGRAQNDPACRELVELQVQYVHTLRCHLRKQNPFPELEGSADPELVQWLRTQRNVPLALLQRMGERLRALANAGRLDTYRFIAIDRTLTELCNIQGGCERIKNTPLPRQYEYLPRVLVSTYCVLLPLGLVAGMGLLTPLASTLVSLIFVSLETIGRDIENPFENTVHDTPLSSLTRMIEINLRQSIDERQLPPEVRAIEGFIY